MPNVVELKNFNKLKKKNQNLIKNYGTSKVENRGGMLMTEVEG